MRYQVAGKSRIKRETRCNEYHESQLAGNARSKNDTVPGRCLLRVAFSIATAIWVRSHPERATFYGVNIKDTFLILAGSQQRLILPRSIAFDGCKEINGFNCFAHFPAC